MTFKGIPPDKEQCEHLPHHYNERKMTEKINFQACIWTSMLIIETFIYGSYSILVNLGKEGGKLHFKSGSVVLLIEFAKLAISCMLFIWEFKAGSSVLPSIKWKMVASFSVPAVLYTFNNNVALYMQLHMDPTTFQVLNNLKIASTALLYKLLIKRAISRPQWMALFLLTCAGICDSYGGFVNSVVAHEPSHIFITVTGFLLMLVYCLVSGIAAVFTEYLYKRVKVSLNVQNIFLYSFGTGINFLTLLWQNITYEELEKGFFSGFSIYTWLIVITQACNGLIMSFVMKHGSNLTRLFIISGGMLTSTALSVIVFQTEISVYFLVAAVLVILAVYLYHH